MEVSIWSDVRCPFCYIGKRRFEEALDNFAQKDKIKVTWRSFELDPGLKTEADINAQDHLAEIKGMSREQVDQMSRQIIQFAEDTDIAFNFEDAVVANSFNAHRLIQFAKSKNKGPEAEEALFKAYFTDGENIDDEEALLRIGKLIGLDEKELQEMLSSDAFSEAVIADEEKAARLRIQGVPFFVFNNKYAVSGAQPTEVFLQTLTESWNEYEENQPLIVKNGAACSTDGSCN